MTREGDAPTIVRKIVVVFDICSSTSILEDLKSTDNLPRWGNLLIGLKTFLIEQSSHFNFDIYKFIGDGWILLFSSETAKNDLLDFVCELDAEFYAQFNTEIEGCLQRVPKILGLTAGVDSGELIRLEMNERAEYLGRAINVASRLQGATKELVGGPSDKVLFSKNSFNSMGQSRGEFRVKEVTVQLRNISNGNDYECLEWGIMS
jgi:class 3 adenylate cyclase